MRNGCQSLIGQLHQCANICAQVRLAANQDYARTGTEIHNFRFPLQIDRDVMLENLACALTTDNGRCFTFFRALSTVSGRLISKQSRTASASL